MIYGRGFREAEPKKHINTWDDPFVELSIEDTPIEPSIGFATSAEYIQTQQLSFDDTHQLFGDMRQIARHHKWLKRSRDESFYRQAVFMKDFTDQWDEETDFSRFYPSYEKMNYGQLRAYFSWRTKLRDGQLQETSLSYVFLFIYEILNNIGVDDPQAGLDQLIFVWAQLRGALPELDEYVLPWIKDYYIYYPVTGSFHSFVSEYQLHSFFPTVYCYSTNAEISFSLFNEMSSYHIADSVFYSEETKVLINNCFCFVLNHLRESFQAKNLVFEDLLFFTSPRKSKWTPFSKALFFPTLKQAARSVKVSDREIYECDGEDWLATKVFPCAQGSQVIGYIMKEIEVFLRGIRSFRYKLTVNIDSFKAIDQGQLSRWGISLPDLVKEGCAAFHKAATWKTVSVDVGNLNLIRKEAVETQEKLIVPEEVDEITLPETPSLSAQEGVLESTATEENGPLSIWNSFIGALDSKEFEALSLICKEESIQEYAAEQGVMIEVLIDDINQKAVDITGDTIMELDDSPYIFEEYLPELVKALQN